MWEAGRNRKGDDGDDDNGERLLTKIEVVVMTGIARDEALRGDALVDALASSEKKTADERMRGIKWEGGRNRGESAGTRGREPGSAEDNNSGAGRSCRLS